MLSSKKRNIATIIIIAVLVIGVFIALKKTPEKEPVKVVETPKFTEQVVGKSVEGRDITAYKYGNGKNKLLFVGGIHGGYEWNSVFLAYKFMDYLVANPNAIPANLTVTVIPSINPDGVFAVTGKDGRFTLDDVSTDKEILANGRFNANEVDLNRNFDCKWQPESMWKSKTVNAGGMPFSEPEAEALRGFVEANSPASVIFWHSQANAVYASKCEGDILPVTLDIMNAYAEASGYPAVKTFNAYPTTGAAEDWLASINIPSITVELKTHETVEWEKNLAGIKALFEYFQTMP